MLAGGTTAILRTSRTIHNEGKPYLYMSAFLRLHINDFQQSPNDLGLVQNVEMRIDQNHPYAYDQQDLELFGNFLYSSNDISRKICHVPKSPKSPEGYIP
jgi:hypothetical protein